MEVIRGSQEGTSLGKRADGLISITYTTLSLHELVSLVAFQWRVSLIVSLCIGT